MFPPASLCFTSAVRPSRFRIRAVVLLPNGSTQIWTAPNGGAWQQLAEARQPGQRCSTHRKDFAMDKGLQHPEMMLATISCRWPCGYRAARAGFDSHE